MASISPFTTIYRRISRNLTARSVNLAGKSWARKRLMPITLIELETDHECGYGVRVLASSDFRYPFADMKHKLDAVQGHWAMETYQTASGAPISGTLGAHAERISSSKQSLPRRDTCSYIYHVHQGSGHSEIKTCTGEVQTVQWGPHDTFSVPAWSQIVHTADGGQDVYLFVLSDRPLLDSLNMYAEDPEPL